MQQRDHKPGPLVCIQNGDALGISPAMSRRAPSYPRGETGVEKGRPRENQSRSNKRGTYHKTDTWRLPCPQEVKKPSASQQEISNHFSDTKATGIRCRSEEEGLQQAEKTGSRGLVHNTRQAGRLRPVAEDWLLESKRTPGR